MQGLLGLTVVHTTNCLCCPHVPVQEYQGEMRQRFSVADIRPTNYASESRRLLGLIEAASS